jgi:hypothetical protein
VALLATACLAWGASSVVRSEAASGDTDRSTWVMQISVYNRHYHYSPEHLRYSPLVGVELHDSSDRFAGGAIFLNSFDQFSQMAYVGKAWGMGRSGFYAKLAVGVLHGYCGEYKDKVPFNYHGFSPAVLPAIGYRWKSLRVETQFLWTNGFMVTAGLAF